MPVYTYVCDDCGKKFDMLVGMTSEKAELKCVKCGSENIKKVFSSFSVGKANPSGPSCPSGTCNL